MVDFYNLLTKEFLNKKYIEEGFSSYNIAKSVGCHNTTILAYLKKYNISRDFNDLFTESFLKEEYINKKKTMQQLAFENFCDISTVRKRLVFFNIPVRNISESKKGKKHTDKHIKNILKAIQASPNKFEVECLKYLNKAYPDKFKYVGDGSLIIDGRSPDAYSKELKTVALFHGDYYHCNPKKYPLNYYNKWLKKTAKEIHTKDKETINIFEKAGYRTIVIWEGDLKK